MSCEAGVAERRRAVRVTVFYPNSMGGIKGLRWVGRRLRPDKSLRGLSLLGLRFSKIFVNGILGIVVFW
jgi:hypothetical protein